MGLLRRPGIHTHDRGYGFRARDFVAPRNDDSIRVKHGATRSKRKAAVTRSRATAAPIIQPLLLAVADAIDRTGPVVGDEDRAILVLDDVGGTAEIALIAFKPA